MSMIARPHAAVSSHEGLMLTWSLRWAIQTRRISQARGSSAALGGMISSFWLASIYRMRVATPNDPKLSHGRAWHGPCAGEGGWGRRRWEAWAVTRTPVGCSAWLGVGVIRTSNCVVAPRLARIPRRRARGRAKILPVVKCINEVSAIVMAIALDAELGAIVACPRGKRGCDSWCVECAANHTGRSAEVWKMKRKRGPTVADRNREWSDNADAKLGSRDTPRCYKRLASG